ncbi:MAG: putative HTH-type transcriptional regulator YttP [Lentisphaerae bacterium ADurb.Bin242]|nr:MAG: putative HTH-type transcriptional regulator YttP [Lentisphaerae bacterium ADurb.Bin242]
MKKLTKGKGQRPGIRFNINGIETRKNILRTAALLFSQRGYSGTSFRDITRASKIGLGSLVYHFGVKENLYAATVAHFYPSTEKLMEIVEALGRVHARSSRKEILEAIGEALAGYLREIHCNKKASFLARFCARLLIDSSPEVQRLLEERQEPVRIKLNEFALRVNPKLTKEQAYAFRRCIVAQIQYTLVSEKAVLAEFKLKSYTPEAIGSIARSIAETSYPLLHLKK